MVVVVVVVVVGGGGGGGGGRGVGGGGGEVVTGVMIKKTQQVRSSDHHGHCPSRFPSGEEFSLKGFANKNRGRKVPCLVLKIVTSAPRSQSVLG